MKNLVYSAYAKKPLKINVNFSVFANILTIAGCILLASKFFIIGYILMLLGSILWYNIAYSLKNNSLQFLNGFYILINLFGLFNNYF